MNMGILTEHIAEFLRQHGFKCPVRIRKGQEILCVEEMQRSVIPVMIDAVSPVQATENTENLENLLNELESEGITSIIITEDRWRRQQEMMKARLLAHLEVFIPMFARNCEVRKVDKETAAEFLDRNHSYGDAACRYRYGLYLKRYTGKKARNDSGDLLVQPDTLVAVATFSNARKWQKGDKVIRSYEWTRYASLPGVRISGGMGKVLKAFIKDVQPDDIMSYADLEWSEGAVYEQLGFTLEGQKAPVMFSVDGQWHRSALKQQSGLCMTAVDMPPTARGCRSGAKTGVNESHAQTTDRYFQNLGSNKYRLKLTEYE